MNFGDENLAEKKRKKRKMESNSMDQCFDH